MTRRASYRVAATQIMAAIMAVIALEAASRLHPFLPSPAAAGAAALDLVVRGEFYRHLGITLYEAATGLAIAAALGVAFGIAIGANRPLTEFLNPIILALYSVPKIVFLPILLMIFGTGLPPKIANAAIHAFFPIVLNSLVGMREVNRLQLKTARSMLATPLQIVRAVYLPSMVLPVLAGIRLGLGLAFLGALLAELFESKSGIGTIVIQFYNQGRIDQMLAVILVVFGLILALNGLMKRLEDSLSRWRRV